MRLLLLTLLGLTLAQPVLAQEDGAAWPRVTEPTWSERNFTSRQREFVDELARSELGRPVRGNKSDLELLQRFVDRSLIPQNETQNLQALGVVLGDIYVDEFETLQWRIYEDQKGNSRAVCVTGTKNCLFPITMLSRRITAGITPDVDEVYQSGLESMRPYLPKLPYQVD